MTPAAPIRVGVVGVGKIARDQHLPALAQDGDFRFVAAADPCSKLNDVRVYPTIADLLRNEPDLDAVALCTPPQARFETAIAALKAGKHVLLEKPPGATLSEVEILTRLAAERGCTLFATWHSRFAAGVAAAHEWLTTRRILSVRIDWREDVRHWHPGQDWIWEPGGLGVFDPGINALSIATEILPQPFYLKEATLEFPSNRAAPIAADLAFLDAEGTPIQLGLDWRQTGPQSWDIRVVTEDGELLLSHGGAKLVISGREMMAAPDTEYAGIYRRFAALIRAGASEVDISPLRHVADAFLKGRHVTVEPFLD